MFRCWRNTVSSRYRAYIRSMRAIDAAHRDKSRPRYLSLGDYASQTVPSSTREPRRPQSSNLDRRPLEISFPPSSLPLDPWNFANSPYFRVPSPFFCLYPFRLSRLDFPFNRRPPLQVRISKSKIGNFFVLEKIIEVVGKCCLNV